MPGTGTGNPAGDNLSPIGNKLSQKPGVLIIELQVFIGTTPTDFLTAEHGPPSG